MSTRRVTEADTATALGSGDVPVLATPRLIEWLEAETALDAAQRVAAGQTTVGVAIEIEHLKPLRVGDSVLPEAILERGSANGRLSYAVQALGHPGTIARGRIVRVVVDRDRFLAGAGVPPPAAAP